ncbi:MAG: helix-turn-helix transcriptional regulator, partial [Lentisphaeria bacterium]
AVHPAVTMGALLTVLGRLADALPGGDLTEEGLSGRPRPPAARPPHPAVHTAAELLEQHPRHPWCLDELARRVSHNPCYLVRRFHADTGLTPMAFLNRVRGEQAATLLVQTTREVRDIGDAVGWPDPRHFARRFKTQFGLSASDYRRRFAGPARTGTARETPPPAKQIRRR